MRVEIWYDGDKLTELDMVQVPRRGDFIADLKPYRQLWKVTEVCWKGDDNKRVQLTVEEE